MCTIITFLNHTHDFALSSFLFVSYDPSSLVARCPFFATFRDDVSGGIADGLYEEEITMIIADLWVYQNNDNNNYLYHSQVSISDEKNGIYRTVCTEAAF